MRAPELEPEPPEPASCSISVAASVVPSHPLSHFGPELVPLIVCTAQDSSPPPPCSYRFGAVAQSPSLVEGTVGALAELLGLELGAGAALAEAG